MSLEIRHLYEFGEFRLDPVERTLTRGDAPVELTPKGFELLSVLVENHGRLLGKDELMDKIWSDSFVEEGNLTFNIRQLRVVLDDDAHHPRYIKTVRRHGYRFIAEVRQISEESSAEAVSPGETKTVEAFPKQTPTPAPKFKKSFAPIFLVPLILLAVAAVILGAWYLKGRTGPPDNSVLTAPFAAEKLSTNGKVGLAAISPDGKNVIYTNGTEKQSVWLRQLESGNNTELIPESDQIYADFAYAPDGNSLYFSRRVVSGPTGGIYRIPVFGGVPQKIIGDDVTPIGISPDGSELAFVRYRLPDAHCAILVASAADGANERRIAVLPAPFYVRDLDFSADGKRLVFAAGQYKNVTNEVELLEVELATGAQRTLTNERFTDIPRLARLPDGGGWLFTGAKIPVLNYHLWKVPEGGGEAVRLRQEAELYDGLSLDKQAARMVATELRYEFQIRFFGLENTSDAPGQLDGDTIDIGPDGRLYFTSWMSGSAEIWSARPDGSNRRQLTNNKWEEDAPIVSPDNGSIYFSSVQTGKWFIWRMNPDGSNPQQISFTKGGTPINVTVDGSWLYFIEHDDSTLWRVSLKTGEEQLVLNKKSYYGFTVLPDGSQVAYGEKQGDEWVIAIVSPPDGQIVKTIHLADKKLRLKVVNWTRDGKNLAYVTKNEAAGSTVLWLQPLDGAAPRQIAALEDKEMLGRTIPTTPDGKFLAVAQGATLHDAVLLKGLR